MWFTLFVILFVVSCSPCSAKAQSGDAYLFQLNQSDWGSVKLIVSPEGVQKSLPKQQLVIQAVPPQWKPIAFWHGGKQICELANDAHERFIYDHGQMSFPKNAKIDRVRTRLKGLIVVKESFRFKPQAFDETDTFIGTFLPTGNANKTRKTIVGVETFRLDDTRCSSAMLAAAGRIMNVVPSVGVALENRMILSDGGRMVRWSLVDWKRTRVNKSDFRVPTNYSQCKNFKEMLNKAISADIDDVARQMNLGAPFGN